MKEFSIPVAIVTGTLFYLLFTRVDVLVPAGDAVGPLLCDSMPWGVFLVLYITFCKINLHDLRPRRWHLWLQLSRLAMALVIIAAMLIAHHAATSGSDLFIADPSIQIILIGCFACIICPTASAAAVVTDKLGGDITSLTVFTIMDCVVTSILIPLFFPLLNSLSGTPSALPQMGQEMAAGGISSMLANSGELFFAVLKSAVGVLIAPLVLALLTRWILPAAYARIRSTKNIAFYLWCYNLAVVVGITIHNILASHCPAPTLALLIIAPAIVAIALFATGKAIARPYGENIAGGQALGQKNTVVAIWLTVTFLNPLAGVAPGAYVIWQNLINAWQLWYKEKYGHVRW